MSGLKYLCPALEAIEFLVLSESMISARSGGDNDDSHSHGNNAASSTSDTARVCQKTHVASHIPKKSI